jgi:hypothetical protein
MYRQLFSGFNKPNLLSAAILNGSRWALAGVSLLAGTVLAGSFPAIAYSAEPAPSNTSPITASQPTASLPDGTYLYGQSAQPDQIGQGYFVFEVNKGNVVGALYMPRSSFDCASGSFQSNELALTVVNSYDRTTNPFTIAVERSSTIASTGNPAQQSISLEGFHRLSTITANDHRMLKVCKQDLQK